MGARHEAGQGERVPRHRADEIDIYDWTELDDSQVQLYDKIAFEGMTRALPPETHPYSELENSLKEKIIGQPAAIESLVAILNRENFRNPDRPMATVLFLGPTGVGKSETAKELARLLHPDDTGAPSPFLKIDCSSFSNGHEVAMLVGSPPGYVSRSQKPYFDADIIEQERSVILFDEIEKGAPELHDLLLQILDDGEVMLMKGEKVSFRDSIIIMTSNLGATEMMDLMNPRRVGFQTSGDGGVVASSEQISSAAKEALKKAFRPEFINRIDQKVVFTPLDDEALGAVLDGYVADANERYEGAGITLTMTPELRQSVVASCEDRHQFGARPVLREYDRLVESKLVEYISGGSIPYDSIVYAALPDESEQDQSAQGVVFYHRPDEAARSLQRQLDANYLEVQRRLDDISDAQARHDELVTVAYMLDYHLKSRLNKQLLPVR